MARTEKQKLKLLYIAQLLMEKTDEEHAVTTQEIIDYLAKNDIAAERKSIYTDIDALIGFGMDIIKVKERPGGYYLASRQFELAELKLLVDAVQSSKFITTKKSRELIGKLESLCSGAQGKQLHRQVVVTNRNKAANENIYYNVDMIYSAIAENVKIRFQYFEWSVNREMKLRRDGSFYEVSPWLLTWDGDTNMYYLIGYDGTAGIMKHYRVDKMLKIGLLEEKRQGKELYEDLDKKNYFTKTFGMFGGVEEKVKLRFDNSLVGVVIDRFGRDISIRAEDDSHFIVLADIVYSQQFLGWLYGLGVKVQVLSPQYIANDMKKMALEIAKLYN